jgi:hypothetical protein
MNVTLKPSAANFDASSSFSMPGRGLAHPVEVYCHPAVVSDHSVVVFGCQGTADGEKTLLVELNLPPDGIISLRTDQNYC